MELEGKRELYRVRMVNQLAVLLRMRINNVHVPGYPGDVVGRAHYATHARIFFGQVLLNSAEGFCTLVLKAAKKRQERSKCNLEREYSDCIKSRRDKIGITRHIVMHQVL